MTITGLEDDARYLFKVRAVRAPDKVGAWSFTASARVTASEPIDYDSDDDRLIEVDSLAKLNAIRYDLDGSGAADDSADNDRYAAAFPDAAENQCADSDPDDGVERCRGYELTANLDFDTGTVGDRTDDAYYNGGAGWLPTATGTGTLTNVHQVRHSTDNRTTWSGWVEHPGRRPESGPGVHYAVIADGVVPRRLADQYIPQVRAVSSGSAHRYGKADPTYFWSGHSGTVTVTRTDYDHNDDGVIELLYTAHYRARGLDLNNDGRPDALLADADGDGVPDENSAHWQWRMAFPNAADNMGCPATGCTGYTLGIGANTWLPVTDVIPLGSNDYDADNDGLIEVSSLLQLHAMRWDLPGKGIKGFEDPDSDVTPPDISQAGAAVAGAYGVAFPGPVANMGCPSGGCIGYELSGNLDFGDIVAATDLWYDSATGWEPIVGYNAVFEYNDKTIRNGGDDVNPFGRLGSDADVRNPPGGAGGASEDPEPKEEPPATGCSNGTVVVDPEDNPGLVADCEVLLEARDTLRGSATLNWSVDTAITSWDGVGVAGTPQRVAQLRLPKRSLTGSIPAGLGSLKALEKLRLNGNELTGTIPAELEDLSNLTHLYLRSNRNTFTGCVPAALEQVPNNDVHRLRIPICSP